MNRLWSWLCKKRKFPNPFSGIRLPRVKLRLTPRLVIIGVAFALVGLHTTANLLAWKVLQREIRKIQSSSDDQYLLIVDLSMSSFGQPMDAAPFYNAAYEFLRQSPDELTEVRRLAEEWSEPGPPPPEALEVVRPYLQ